MGVDIITGYTDTHHITPEMDAGLYKSIFGAGNAVLDTGTDMALTVKPGNGSATTGSVEVSPGYFSFDGRIGRIEGSATATYSRPQSDSSKTRVCVAVHYAKSASGTESFTLVCRQSAFSADASAAEIEFEPTGGEPGAIGIYSTGITPGITSAYFPLWEFIAGATSYTSVKKLFEVRNGLPGLLGKIVKEETDRKAAITTEAQTRSSKDSSIDAQITQILNRLSSFANLPSKLRCISYGNTTLGIPKGNQFYFGFLRIYDYGAKVETVVPFFFTKTTVVQRKLCSVYSANGEQIFVSVKIDPSGTTEYSISGETVTLRKNATKSTLDSVTGAIAVTGDSEMYGWLSA